MTPLEEATLALKEGRLQQAEALLLPIASRGDAGGLHLLGMLRDRMGDVSAAEDLVRKAIRLAPKTAGFHSSLAMILAKKENPKDAVLAAARAVELDPSVAAFHHNLGLALSRNGEIGAAIDSYRRALARNPNLARSHECLGHLLSLQGQDTEALSALFASLELEATADARFGVAVILSRRQEFAEAQNQLALALEIDPDHVPSLILLSRYESTSGQGTEAEIHAKRAVELAPDNEDATIALADATAALGRREEAKALYEKARKQKPSDARSLIGTVGLLWFEGKHSVASEQLELALEKYPDDPLILEALGYSLYIEGDAKRAIEYARKAITLEPNRLSSRSLLLALQYQDTVTPREERFHWAVEWNRIASQWHKRMPAVAVDRKRDRPLRVGYVSGCFRTHPVGTVMQPVFAKHDPRAVEVVLYANQVGGDETTTLFRHSTKEWRSVPTLSHPDLADLIRKDRIDILVDLAGQSSGHRLEVFMRKPAPIQVTWNWLATTGLSAMDYTFCDDVVMPPEEEQWWLERPWRLPGSHVPIPRLRLPTVVHPLPFDRNGFITFGCFNNLYKVTDTVVGLWAEILHRIPTAKLVMCMTALQSQKIVESVRERFAAHKITDHQLILAPGAPRYDFLRGYNEIDISLDPFPYNGGMSTLESSFMGVPVVVMLGDSLCSRIGASIATAFGLEHLVAKSHGEYIAIAEKLAGDRDTLSMLRASLRGRVDQASDPAAFARKLEAAYRGMWHDFLAPSG